MSWPLPWARSRITLAIRSGTRRPPTALLRCSFPKLAERYGPSVNYAEGKHQHVQVEFAFDIDQIAQHHLAPLGYLRHIGLRVPQRQVALAFYQTYGLTESFDGSRGRQFINMSAYNMATRKLIPRIAYALTCCIATTSRPSRIQPDAAEIEKEAAAVDNGLQLGRLSQESQH